MDHDLGLADRPDDDEFDDFVLHVDGWLCEIKDAQIRDGLHVLGQAPVGAARVNLVLAMLRAAQVWGGQVDALPGLRSALGLTGRRRPGRAVDAVEAPARALVRGGGRRRLGASRRCPAWSRSATGPGGPGRRRRSWSSPPPRSCPGWPPPPTRSTSVLHALDGGFVPAGPSGSPLRGLINVLPTGRNFYTVDPKAVPSRLAYETGQAMADSLIARYRADTGEFPKSVGLSVWGTSAMRTAGDDIAEVLALIGVTPVWDEASRRISDLHVVPASELGRPRIDVTVRISGFFRDAFPHVVTMLDDAMRLVANLDEPDDVNYVRAHARADLAEHGDERRATTRIFGSAPGAYGAGLLPLMESGNWRDDADLAQVYTAWGGFAYGRDLDGAPATPGHADELPADRGGGQEHRHPRTRHRRLRRLLPVPRRHGRHRTGADRAGAPRLHRRLHQPGRGAHPLADRGDRAGIPGPGGESRAGSRRCAGTATRARSSWPPPSTTCSATTPPRGSSPTGCTSRWPAPTRWTSRTRPS